MPLKIKTFLLLMLLSAGLIGCARAVVLYPITHEDFSAVKKNQPAPFDGYLMSEFYLNQVLEVKLENK